MDRVQALKGMAGLIGKLQGPSMVDVEGKDLRFWIVNEEERNLLLALFAAEGGSVLRGVLRFTAEGKKSAEGGAGR